jgi:hypothetical protein
MKPKARFSDEYRTLVERFVRPLRSEDGVAESTIAAGEKRLGFGLPRILREFYLLAGNLKRINGAQERLLPPDNPNRLPRCYTELTLAGAGLAVFVENQGGCLWGIESASLDHSDPPVAIALDIDRPVWEPFHDSLSGFLIAMFYHQASHWGLRYAAVAHANARLVTRVKRNWPLAAHFGNLCTAFDPEESEPAEFFSRGGQIIAFRDGNLHVATKTHEQREAARQELGVEWTWHFPEDFPSIYSSLKDGWED